MERSKEVNNAINNTNIILNGIFEYGDNFSFRNNRVSMIAYNSLTTVLRYITELEEKVTKLECNEGKSNIPRKDWGRYSISP